MRDILTQDTEFYEMNNLSLESLVGEAFIKAFIEQGSLTLFSHNEPARMSQNLRISPDGILRLILPSQSLPYLGLAQTCITDKVTDLCIAELNLKSLIKNPKRHSEISQIFRQKLVVPGPFLLSWKPESDSVCPSSVAKYFHDLGAKVVEKSPEIKLIRTETCLDKIDDDFCPDLLETWVGAKLLKIDPRKLNLEGTNETRCLIAQTRGLFLNHTLKGLTEEMQKLPKKDSSGFSSVMMSTPDIYAPSKCLKKKQKNSSLLETSRLTIALLDENVYQIKNTVLPLT